VERESETTAVLNGNWGFGFVMTERAMQLAIRKAKAWGTSAVAIRYQGHIGRLGAYAATAAAEGLIAIMTSDSGRGPKSVAPFGGRSRRLGTNPICIAVPSNLPGPVILDMATSSVAVGKLLLASSRHEPVDDGLLVDADGNPSNDPNSYFSGGAILPLGGRQGHKGFGLSFMVEVLCGILTGLGYGVAADGRHNDGCFIGLFDPARFRPMPDFLAEVDDFVDYIKSSPTAAGHAEVLYPGELEYRTHRERTAHGFDVEDETWSTLARTMRSLGVDVPNAVV
jgi:uncharacterized oxidoreductase